MVYEDTVYFNFTQYINMCDKKVYEEIKKTTENIAQNLESTYYINLFEKWEFDNIKRYSTKDNIALEKQRLGVIDLEPINFYELPNELERIWTVENIKEFKIVKKNIYDVTELYKNQNFSRKFNKQSEYLKNILEHIE